MMYRLFPVFLLISRLPIGFAVAQTLSTSTVVTQLPSALGQVVPICAQECVRSAVTQSLRSRACPVDDLACLCSTYDDDGYTIGERAYACLYAGSCSSVARSVDTQIYFICSGIQGAVSPTQRTLVVTATSQPSRPTSTSSTSSLISPIATTLITTTKDQASSSGISFPPTNPTALAAAQVPVVESLSDAQVAGIVIAAIAFVVLITAMFGFAWFRRLRRRLSRNGQPEKALLHHPDESQRRVDLAPAVERIDPRRSSEGVGIRPRSRLSLDTGTQPRYDTTAASSSRRHATAVDMTIGLATTANVPIAAQSMSPPRTPRTHHQVHRAASPPSNPHPVHSSRPYLFKELPQVPPAVLTRSNSADRRVLYHRWNKNSQSRTHPEYSNAVDQHNFIYTSQAPTSTPPPRARSAPRVSPARNEIVFPPSNEGVHRQIHPALRGEISLDSTNPDDEPLSAPIAPTVARLICAARDSPTFDRRGQIVMHYQSTQEPRNRPSIEALQHNSDSGTSSAIPSSDVLPANALRPSSSVIAHPTPSQPQGIRASMLSCTTFETSSCESESEDEGDYEKPGLSDEEAEAASPISEIRYPQIPRLSSSMIPIRLEQPESPPSAVEPSAASHQSPPPVRSTPSESHRRERVRSPRTPEYRPYRPGARDTTRYLPGSASTRQVTPGLVSPSSQYSQRTDTTASSECPFYYDGGADDSGLIYQLPQLTPQRKGDEMFLSVA